MTQKLNWPICTWCKRPLTITRDRGFRCTLCAERINQAAFDEVNEREAQMNN